MAVAEGLKNQPNHVGNKFIPCLLKDSDIGVIKVTLKFLRNNPNTEMEDEIRKLVDRIKIQRFPGPGGEEIRDYILDLAEGTIDSINKK